jgi:transcriptional regulator with GAF, ATPase, and Fis domain
VTQTGQAVLAERRDGEEKIACLAVPLRTEQQVVGVLGIDAKPAHSFDENDSYQLSILANFAAVALSNAQLITDLQDRFAVSSRQSAVEPAGAPEVPSLPDVAESVAEAQRLSGELRNLADAVQVLAEKLQRQSGALRDQGES